jgi:sugar/nucleoside kinase (ribokinase family)
MHDPVLVVGSVAFDDVETPFGKRRDALGGSAIFFSMAASHFTHIRIVGVAGNDFPDSAIAMLKSHNIDVDGLKIVAGKTFRWGGVYHQNMNDRDTLYTHLNVFADFKPDIPKQYRRTQFLFLGNIQPALQLDVLNQIKNPKFCALDTMNLWINTTLDDLLKVIAKVDLILINDSELCLLTGESNLRSGLAKLHRLGPEYIVIKKGEHGSFLSHSAQLFFTPAYPVDQAIDPTGAGDGFAGGFMGYLASCSKIDFNSMKRALVYGSVLGSYVVEDFSVDRLKKIDRDQIENRYQALRRLVTI